MRCQNISDSDTLFRRAVQNKSGSRHDFVAPPIVRSLLAAGRHCGARHGNGAMECSYGRQQSQIVIGKRLDAALQQSVSVLEGCCTSTPKRRHTSHAIIIGR
jgi:hypothetical protein